VKNFFRDGWDFGLFTLVIGLPILAALLYLFGVSAWEVLSNPTKYWLAWLYLVVWLGPTLINTIKKLMKKSNAADGVVIDG
jgi:hypothetical protein